MVKELTRGLDGELFAGMDVVWAKVQQFFVQK